MDDPLQSDGPEDASPQADGGGPDPDWLAAVEASPFARCATCRNASGIDVVQGTLLCNRFNMLINAEADEIPDVCPEYEHDPNKPIPPDVTDHDGAEPHGAEGHGGESGGVGEPAGAGMT